MTMKLVQYWRQFNAPRVDYAREAIALFTRFSQRHGLSYAVKEEAVLDQAGVDVWWEFPVQNKLCWPITLMLQNFDELSFGVPGFWSYLFPFSSVADKFESYIDAWVAGEARIVRRPGRWRITSISDLEIFSGGKWTRVYSGGGDAWPHQNIMTIRNVRT
jgi:hypothetical protein